MKISDQSTTPMVSVIIPVFNTEQYLDQALLSIRFQTLKELQIICVDDASTDGSLAALRRHADEDPRISVIACEANIGLGAVRNLALHYAEGRYVYFFDSDDMLDPQALEKIAILANANELDSVFFNARPLIDESMDSALLSQYQRQYMRRQSYTSGISGPEMVLEMSKYGEWKPSACLYLTRREFLYDAGLRFTEGVLHEDNGFTMRLMLSASRLGYDSSEFFVRRVRADSITTTTISEWHVRSLVIAAAELAVAARSQRIRTDFSAEVSIAVATQAELILHDAIRKYLRLEPREQEKISEWQPSWPEHVFVRCRLLERVNLENLEAVLLAREEEAQTLRAENASLLRSRAVRLARRLRSIQGLRSR
ncbi:glycosyltransferase family 2 protein [Leucobacter sp. W1153]|uniref:glycosyltransferase family 2 protein n=1 Tax=Leucobacter sp. W1153 TaxID=3439064 RepID=UPI003F3F5B53